MNDDRCSSSPGIKHHLPVKISSVIQENSDSFSDFAQTKAHPSNSSVHNGLNQEIERRSPENKRSATKSSRPSLQIYRPPGLRSGSSTLNATKELSPVAAVVPQKLQAQGIQTGTHQHCATTPKTENSILGIAPSSHSPSSNGSSSKKESKKNTNHYTPKERKKESSIDSNSSTESHSKPIQTAGSKQSHIHSSTHSRTPTSNQRIHEKLKAKSPPKQACGGQKPQKHQHQQNSKEEQASAEVSAGSSGRKPSPGPQEGPSNQPGSTGPVQPKNPAPPSPGVQRRRGPSPAPTKEKEVKGGEGGRNRAPSPGAKMLGGRQNSFVRDQQQNKKIALSPGDIEDIKELFGKLELKDSELLLKYIQSGFESTDLATPTAQSLVQSAIEDGKGSKSVAKLCSLLMEGSSGSAFHQGLITASWQYFECREKLRCEHFKFWLAFLNFISDLYATIGFTYEGELVEILFRVFEFMLKSPVLETLKIDELECLISSLLSVGYDLERQCPDKLSTLRDSIRDAFMHAQEPWARKMILLLVELSASGWKLPAESDDYYFQTTATSL